MNVEPHDHARRRDERLQIRLPARVLLAQREFSAETEDVSEMGAKLRLPLPLEHALLLGIRAVVIEELGHFDCRLAWVRDFRIGVEFRNPVRGNAIRAAYVARCAVPRER